MYVLVENGEAKEFPYSLGDLARDFPQVSFPGNPSAETLQAYSIFPVSDSSPVFDPATQVATRDGCGYDANTGAWVARWAVRNLTDAEIAGRKAERRKGMQLTFAQLMIGLVSSGWITEAEGEAWLAGTLPPAVLTLIGTLPEGQRFAAKARAVRPSVVLRTDPLVSALAQAQGKSDDELDDFFVTYAQV